MGKPIGTHIFFKFHDDVVKYEHFPHYLTFVRGIHRLPVDSLKKACLRNFSIFFYLHLNKRSSKQSRWSWLATPSRSLWRRCHVFDRSLLDSFTYLLTRLDCSRSPDEALAEICAYLLLILYVLNFFEEIESSFYLYILYHFTTQDMASIVRMLPRLSWFHGDHQS